MMQGARWDDEDVIGTEGVGCLIYDNRVFIFEGHDNLHGRMPVQGIVFSLHIMIEFYAGEKIIVHCFADTV